MSEQEGNSAGRVIFHHIKHDWWLVLNSEFRVSQATHPCWFHRFWQRLLLGWKWEPRQP